MKKKKLSYPNDGGLKNQVRPFDETIGAFYILKKPFFPHLFDAETNEKSLTK